MRKLEINIKLENLMHKSIKLFVLASAAFLISGCTALGTAIENRNLEASTQMSSSVFLDPVSPSKRTVYLQIRNTSDKSDYNILPALTANLSKADYRIVNDPDQAHYMLQANVLSVGKMKPESAQAALRAGYRGALTGAAISYATGGSGNSIARGGLIFGAAEWAGNLLVKNINYSSITDIQISERSRGTVKTTSKHNLKQGNSGSTTEYYEEERNWKRYQTRVVSNANQVNLEWSEARPELVKGLAKSVAGLF